MLAAVVLLLGLALGLKAPAKAPVRAQTAAASPVARNDQRREQLKQLAAAFKAYTSATGNPALSVPARQTGICLTTGSRCRAAGLVDLSLLVSKGYLAGLPNDPVGARGELYATGYTIGRDGAGAVMLTAPRAENGASITQRIN